MKKTNVMRILDQKGILYRTFHTTNTSEQGIDALSVAEALAVDTSLIYKTLVLEGDLHGYVIALIPANAQLNLKSIAKATQNKKVEMISFNSMQEITGYIRGGCSPIGMKKLYPTIIDLKAKDLKGIIISAGKRG